MKLLLTFILQLSLAACAFVNPVIGYQRGFSWHLDGLIGESVSTLEKEVYSGLWVKINTVHIDEHFYEIHLLHRESSYQSDSECTWSAKIEKDSLTIKSWRYLSDPSVCKLPYFYEGAW